ncbi:hypothetical protein JTE90_004763 [Oedothorax gibbosus]|uniref:Cationic amino acid transporter C-terminal domain-containing protein n=1 Tax=Oedothorax gibbosus TaxID=931172 RepID=A0AAV6UWN1_9ARAC|nr:hypothetical protein JTE90_004763 [Oedothorax gibbosus]
MMMRTKPQYLSVLGRKRSSVHSTQKLPQNSGTTWTDALRSCVCVVVMCCSVLYGIVLLILQDNTALTTSNLLVPLIIAGVASITGGICLSEYLSSESNEVVPSTYSCCYQRSSEVLAFFLGWTWILSQASLVASICKSSALLVDQWTDNAVTNLLGQSSFLPYPDALPAFGFVLVCVLFVVTGLSDSLVWFVVFVPLAFVMALVSFAVVRWSGSEEKIETDMNWFGVESIDEALRISTLCLLFFSGPQSLLRISETKVRQKTTATVGPLNVVCFKIVLTILFMAYHTGNSLQTLTGIDNSTEVLASNILHLICLCILGVETFYTLHFVIEDMATDGLLFRSLSKKKRPFCFPIASGSVQILCGIVIGLMVMFLPITVLMVLSVVFPLIVNSWIPFLVLIQRYRDNTTWQYEPMFHTKARNLRNGSRQKIQESQYTNGIGYETIAENPDVSTTCIDEDSPENDSDTDIDSVVQQYKDQAKIANMAILEEHDPSKQVPEPTPSSSFRAKVSIAALFLAASTNAVVLNFADMDNSFSLVVVSVMCLMFSIVILGTLLCLPQNGTQYSLCCTKVHSMPFIPGLSAFVNLCLLVYCLLITWEVFLGWLMLGFLIYFGYGIRSSTAAKSFYNLQPAHINLNPLPSHRKNCIPQVVPSQRKKLKSLQKNGRRKVYVT